MAPRGAIFGCLGLELSPAEAAFFRAADPWGFILFARNLDTAAQITALTRALRDAVGRDAPILIDQEGGRVARLTPPGWTAWEDALAFTRQFPDAASCAQAMRLRYHVISAELLALGIDVNCAPMVDIAGPETHPAIGERCYGTTAADVAALGRTPLDSHFDLPSVDVPRAVLDAEEFAPFKALADLPLGMLAHIVYPAIDAERPAGYSLQMERVIREDLGFSGLLMCDDLSMKALTGPIGARAAHVMAAGYDLALHCNGEMPEMEEVAANTAPLSGASLTRHQAVMAQRAGLAAKPIDIADTLAQIDALRSREMRHA